MGIRLKWFNKPQNPNLAGYWVGKLVYIGEQISDWDFEEDAEAISPGFKGKREFNEWKRKILWKPVLITSLNSPAHWRVDDSHFYIKFADGRELEAPCGLTNGMPFLQPGERGLPETIQEAIEEYEMHLFYPKIEAQINKVD